MDQNNHNRGFTNDEFECFAQTQLNNRSEYNDNNAASFRQQQGI